MWVSGVTYLLQPSRGFLSFLGSRSTSLTWCIGLWVILKWSEVKVAQSCLTLCAYGLCRPLNFPGQNTGVGSCSLLQGIFPNQESNPGLPDWRRILYQLSHKGSLRVLEWVAACPFSSGSSWLRNWTRVSCIADRFFTSWAAISATP